jgi:hypothetical protein
LWSLISILIGHFGRRLDRIFGRYRPMLANRAEDRAKVAPSIGAKGKELANSGGPQMQLV